MVNSREQNRVHRMGVISSWVAQAKRDGADINVEKLIATACIEFGCSRRTAMEYIGVLVNAEKIRL